jgi:hypothetical protein
MITNEVVRAAGDDDAGVEESQLELAQVLLAATVGKGDEGRHDDFLRRRRRFQRRLDVLAIESEDGHLHAFLRVLDGRKDRGHTGVRLDDHFHDATSSDCSLYSSAYTPPLARSESWVPCSTSSASLMTKMTSACRIELR